MKTHLDVKRAFNDTGCDAVMIGRAAIGYPFIFREAKYFLETGLEQPPPTIDERFEILLEHLKLEMKNKGDKRGIYEFRKNYTGYLKGLYNSHSVRPKLVTVESYDEIVDALMKYKEENLSEQ